jgi:hypothetical protein
MRAFSDVSRGRMVSEVEPQAEAERVKPVKFQSSANPSRGYFSQPETSAPTPHAGWGGADRAPYRNRRRHLDKVRSSCSCETSSSSAAGAAGISSR